MMANRYNWLFLTWLGRKPNVKQTTWPKRNCDSQTGCFADCKVQKLLALTFICIVMQINQYGNSVSMQNSRQTFRSNRRSQQAPSNIVMSVYAVLIIFLVSDVVKIDALSYASLTSDDGKFNLQWTYNNSKLIFKMTCKTTGWCAVGFTKTADGKDMVNYDIAVAGYASSAGYINVSCIFVFIYLFDWGCYVICFSQVLASRSLRWHSNSAP